MKIRHITSSTHIVEMGSTNILVDPWLTDGEYFGSWYHYPKVDINKLNLNYITHIYVSHIHPDHFSKATFELLNKNIPVIIHSYKEKFLKLNLENIGFKVVELNNGDVHNLDDKSFIQIYAADNCNPILCNKYLGCAKLESNIGSTQIDSLALFSDGESTLLNLNDCPIDLAKNAINILKKNVDKIDMLLVGYGGAGPYPQCFEMSNELKLIESEKKKIQFLEQAVDFVKLTEPRYFMPYAGTYVIGGELSSLDKYKGVPELDYALEYIEQKINNNKTKGLLLNRGECFDIKSGIASAPYISVDPHERNLYVLNELTEKKYTYHNISFRDEDLFEILIPQSIARLKEKVYSIGFESNTVLYIGVGDQYKLRVTFLKGDVKYEIQKRTIQISKDSYVFIDLHIGLLYLLLKGPKYAHWNNAEIGSHLKFKRFPNTYERGLYYVLCFLHC